MVKLVGPALSLSAQGALKKKIVFQKTPSGHKMYVDHSHMGVPSPVQIARKAQFQDCINEWKALDQSEKDSYNELAKFKSMTGYNYFMMSCLQPYVAPVPPGEPWYNALWQYRQKITVDKTKLGGEDQTDYPVYVNLSQMSAGFFSHVKADGSDIVVTESDKTTKVKRDLRYINTGTEKGKLLFRAGTLLSSEDGVFYIYYGYAGASETNNTDTYPATYKAVWGHDEASGNLIDRTANGCTGTAEGSPAYRAVGPTDYAIDYELNDSDAFDVGTRASLNITGDLTIATGFNVESVSPADNMCLAGKDEASNRQYWLYLNHWEFDKPHFEVYSGASAYNVKWPDAPSLATWYDLVGVFDASETNLYIYRNGALANTNLAGPASIDGYSSKTCVARRNYSGYYSYFDGLLVETWIIADAMPLSWVTTRYNNLYFPDTFYTVGAEETYGA